MKIMIGLLFLFAAATSTGSNTTVEIAPGVFMPLVNMGGVTNKPSNYSLFIELGGRGLDCAWDYNSAVQSKLEEAISASAVGRKELFITSKVRCCQNGGTPGTGGKDDDDLERKCTPNTRYALVDPNPKINSKFRHLAG